MLGQLTAQLKDRTALSTAQVRDAVGLLVSETDAPDRKAEFLIALSEKGETAQEIAAFAAELRERAIRPHLDPAVRSSEILDVCGTGGDKLNTFNISTTVAILVASAEVFVAKHGNRAITSQSGSADVLDELGIPTMLTPEQAAKSLGDQHFAFFFAPNYHPAFKQIGPARKLCAERGQRTIFNFLGPLLNPAQPSAQLMGVSRPELTRPLAEVLQQLGSRRAMVVSGRAGEAYLDEISTLGETTFAEFERSHGPDDWILSPEQFALQTATLEELRGGDRKENARVIHEILSGRDRGPKRDAVLINSAAALFVAGKAGTMSEGWDLADELINNGRAYAKLLALSNYRP